MVLVGEGNLNIERPAASRVLCQIHRQGVLVRDDCDTAHFIRDRLLIHRPRRNRESGGRSCHKVDGAADRYRRACCNRASICLVIGLQCTIGACRIGNRDRVRHYVHCAALERGDILGKEVLLLGRAVLGIVYIDEVLSCLSGKVGSQPEQIRIARISLAVGTDQPMSSTRARIGDRDSLQLCSQIVTPILFQRDILQFRRRNGHRTFGYRQQAARQLGHPILLIRADFVPVRQQVVPILPVLYRGRAVAVVICTGYTNAQIGVRLVGYIFNRRCCFGIAAPCRQRCGNLVPEGIAGQLKNINRLGSTLSFRLFNRIIRHGLAHGRQAVRAAVIPRGDRIDPGRRRRPFCRCSFSADIRGHHLRAAGRRVGNGEGDVIATDVASSVDRCGQGHLCAFFDFCTRSRHFYFRSIRIAGLRLNGNRTLLCSAIPVRCDLRQLDVFTAKLLVIVLGSIAGRLPVYGRVAVVAVGKNSNPSPCPR